MKNIDYENLRLIQENFRIATDMPNWVYNLKDIKENEIYCENIYDKIIDCCIHIHHLLVDKIYTTKQLNKIIDEFIIDIDILHLLIYKEIDGIDTEQQYNDILIYLMIKTLKTKNKAIKLELYEIAQNITNFINMTNIPNKNINKIEE